MKAINTNAKEYINNIENKTRKKDATIVMSMISKITKLTPSVWGPAIIGFGKYTHKYETGRETNLPLSSFSPRKSYLVFYVLNGFENQEELLKKLGKHRAGNICLYINKLSGIKIEVLESIIKYSFQKNKKYIKH